MAAAAAAAVVVVSITAAVAATAVTVAAALFCVVELRLGSSVFAKFQVPFVITIESNPRAIFLVTASFQITNDRCDDSTSRTNTIWFAHCVTLWTTL